MSSITLVDLAGILVLGTLCWGLRAAFVLAMPAERLPAVVPEALQYLAPAALASICAVELSSVIQQNAAGGVWPAIGVAALAAMVAVMTRNLTWTVLAGIVSVVVLDLVLLAR